jgi:4-amino-4-deoxy-L-arabinose transferase-like glycosyltransferase
LAAVEYLTGVVLLAVTGGSAVAIAALVVRRRLADMPPYARGAAAGLIVAAALIAAYLLPATVGVLDRLTAAACSVLLVAAVAFGVRARSRPAAAAVPAPREPLPSRLLAFVATALVAGWSLAAAWVASVTPSTGHDTLTFHLPNVVTWLQTGSVWRVDQFEPLLANGYYPQNGDVLSLALIAPFGDDAFVRLLGVASLALAALAVYALARELSAPPAAAALASALLASLPIAVLTAEEGGKTDLMCLAALAAGGLFLVRHARGGDGRDLALAGLGLGLAFGTKWYGVTSVAAIVAVWAVVRLAKRPPVPRFVREVAVLGALCAAAGGLWLLRNWIVGGNPVAPVQVELGGLTVFSAAPDPVRDCTGFAVADYLTSPDVLRQTLWPIYRFSLGPGALPLLGALLIGPLLCRDRRVALTLTALGALLLAIYAITPYSAFGGQGQPVFAGPNVRYALPAFAVAAALLATLLPRLGRLRPLAELLTVVAIADGLRRGLLVPGSTFAAGVAAAAVVVAVVVAVSRVAPRRLPRRYVAAGLALCAFAALLLGYARQREFHDHRYRGADPALDVLAHTPPGTRVALAGFESGMSPSHVLPAFGAELQNRVTYAGPTVDGQLRTYEDPAALARAVERGGYDYLLVARNDFRVPCDLPGFGVDETAWAEQAGYERLTVSDGLALFRIRPRG